MSQNLFRALSTVFVVSSAAFAKAKPVDQTAALTQNDGKPILFVDNFAALSNKKAIRDNLLTGKDVSVELEFNGIELTDEDRRVLSLVGPILEKITGITGGYPWVTPPVGSIGPVCEENRISRQGYDLPVDTAKRIWAAASRVWAGGAQPSKQLKVQHNYENRHVQILDTKVQIGCQTISRWEVEAVALHYDWEPNIS